MHLLFRCDAAEDTGFGHVSRCLGLAEAVEDAGGSAKFLGRFHEAGSALIRGSGFDVEAIDSRTGTEADLEAIVAAVSVPTTKPDVVILDSYEIDAPFVEAVQNELGPLPLILIDDFAGLDAYRCFGVINFTVTATQRSYPDCGQHLLLGPEFFPAKRWLQEARKSRSERENDSAPANAVNKVLVLIGGTDRNNLALRVTRELHGLSPDSEVSVIARVSPEQLQDLQTALSGFPTPGRIVSIKPTLLEEFKECDVCICGGGLTKYEAAYAGVPTAALSQTPEQHEDTLSLEKLGITHNLGLAEATSDDELHARLHRFLEDKSLRQDLIRRGLTCFPQDCHARAIREILSLIS